MYGRPPPSSSAIEAQLAAPQQHGAAAIHTEAQEAVSESASAPPPKHQGRQPPPPPGMPVQSPWRRSACDRCRAQKLRCLRSKEDDISMPCTRCIRVRHPCFTSSAKPPGRSSGRMPPAAPELNASASTSTGGKRAARQRASERVSPVAPGGQSPVLMEWPLLYQDGDQSEEAAVFEEGVMNMMSFDESHPTDFFKYLASMPPCISLSPSYGFDLVGDGPDDEHADTMDMNQEDQVPMPCLAPSPPIQHCRGVLLARLLESLSTQLVQLNSEAWDLGVLSLTGSTVDSGEVDVAAAEALASEAPVFNPLLTILVSTSKFLDICRLFAVPEASGGAGEAQAATSAAADAVNQAASGGRLFSTHDFGDGRPSFPSPSSLPGSTRVASSSSSSPTKGTESSSSSPPGMPTSQVAITASQLLTLVSCYLQVVTIYNDIFSHLLVQLAQPPTSAPPSSSTQHQAAIVPGPSGANANAATLQQQHGVQGTRSGLPMTPSLMLAGFSVPLSASLRMRLLVEVVEHQFEQIEHTLGLPGPYCVSTASHPASQGQQRKNGSGGGGGLLARREAPTLLDAVIGLSSKGDDADDSHDCGGIGVVASLRENLRKAQRVRRGGG